MSSQISLYNAHLAEQLERISGALAAAQCDHLWIDNGGLLPRFADDTRYPFRANPYLAEVVPLTSHPYTHLFVTPGNKPRLAIQQREDIWHSQAPLPEQCDAFDVVHYTDQRDLKKLLPAGRVAAITSQSDHTSSSVEINPPRLLDFLDYQRAVKTDYAIAQTVAATRAAAAGHKAAYAAFSAGANEQQIHREYLYACGQSEYELPYDAIVAIDSNAAVLHHTLRSDQAHHHQSLLLDAGASSCGYASDITRTLAGAKAPALFRELIAALDSAQQQLAETVIADYEFIDLQRDADLAISKILCASNILHCSLEQAIEEQLVGFFFPHGIGHLLGVQVHDRGGQLADPTGRPRPPPQSNPMLRCTRRLEENMLVTVEPGIYFIPQLLAKIPTHQRPLINWQAVEELLPCGGIRIEDNVVAGPLRGRNLTREQLTGEPTS